LTEQRILLAQGSPEDGKLMLRALRKNGFANPVDVTTEGRAALRALHRSDAPTYGLVVLDLDLPDMHGLDVLGAIRADPQTGLLPVVVFTSNATGDDIRRSYELGANGFVRKPAGCTEFIRSAAAMARFWLDANERPAVRPAIRPVING